MVHEKYIKVGDRLYGPYYYESYREDGKVKKRYIKAPVEVESKSNVNSEPISQILGKAVDSSQRRVNVWKILFIFFIVFFGLFLVWGISLYNQNPDAFPQVGKISSDVLKGIVGFSIEGSDEGAEIERSAEEDGSSSDEGGNNVPEGSGGVVGGGDSLDEADAGVDSEVEVGDEDGEPLAEEETGVENEIIPEEETLYEGLQNKSSEEQQNESEIGDLNITVEINQTETNETTSQNDANLSEIIVEDIESNLTLSNVSIGNDTNVSVRQFSAVIGRPVKWIAVISVGENDENIEINIPKEATEIKVKTGGEIEEALNELEEYELAVESAEPQELMGGSITGFVTSDIAHRKSLVVRFFEWLRSLTITGKVIDEAELSQELLETEDAKILDVSTIAEQTNEKEIAVEYYTEAPLAIEEEMRFGKKVVVSGPEEVRYEEVLAYTSLPENSEVLKKDSIQIFWKEGDSLVDFTTDDLDGDGLIDYVEWIVPHLSNQTFEIIIKITRAEHLDFDRNFISDIYESVSELDGNWSETINDGGYVRVWFEQNLTAERDITVYPRIVSGAPQIEVYENNGSEVVALFENLSDGQNKVFLNGSGGAGLMNRSQDVFDLKVLNGAVEFDWIVDPFVDNGSAIQYVGDCGILNTTGASYLLNASVVVNGTCLNITASNVYVNCNGFTINYSANGTLGYGIVSRFVKNITIVNCIIVEGVTTTNAKYGIYLWSTNDSLIRNNTVRTIGNTAYPIYINSDSRNNSIVNNILSSTGANGHGIVAQTRSHQVYAAYNNISGTANPAYGIYLLTDINWSVIEHNIIRQTGNNGFGVVLSTRSSMNNVTNNTIRAQGNPGYGVYLTTDCSLNNLINNTVTTTNTNGYGLYLLTRSNLNLVSGNSFYTGGTTGYGIYLNAVGNNTLINNLVNTTGSNAYGFFISSSGNNTFYNNSANTTQTQNYVLLGTTVNHYNNSIDTTNFGDGRPVNYTFNANGLVIDGADLRNFSRMIFGWSNNVSIKNSEMTRTGLSLFAVSNSTFVNNNISTTGSDAVFAYQYPRGNLFENNSINTSCTNCYVVYVTTDGGDNVFRSNSISSTGSGAYGIYLFTRIVNTSLDNNLLRTTNTNGHAIILSTDINNTQITNNNITTTSSGYGIYFTTRVYASNVTNNSILVSGSGIGIYLLTTSSHNLFESLNILPPGTGEGIQIRSPTTNNTFRNINVQRSVANSEGLNIYEQNVNFSLIDSVLNASAGGTPDLYIRASGAISSFWNFTNVTFNDTTWSTGANGTLLVGWYVDAYSNYTNSSNASNVNISGFSVDGIVRFNQLTNESGYMNRQVVLDYIRNGTSGTNYIRYSNYTFNATAPTGENLSQSWNMTTNQFLIFTFSGEALPPTPGLNVWISASNQLWTNLTAWSQGRAPIAGDDVVFNASGIGPVNVTNNSIPQNLNSFTVEPSYSGRMYFAPLFAVGAWGSNVGTQEWNVTNNINISNGTIYVYGDGYNVTETWMANPGMHNITADGHGQIWRSLNGNVTIGANAVVDGNGLGFGEDSGPGRGYDGGGYGSGGGHGGEGGDGYSNTNEGISYGNSSAPTSIGSGGGRGSRSGAGVAGSGGSSLMIQADYVYLNGGINMNGGGGAIYSGAGAGGAVYIKTNILNGSGNITVDGANGGGQYGGGGGGGKIALEYNSYSYNGIIRAKQGNEGSEVFNVDPHNAEPGVLYLSNYNNLPKVIRNSFGLMEGNYNFSGEDVVISGGAMLFIRGNSSLIFNNIIINQSSTLRSKQNASIGMGLQIVVFGNLSIESNSKIDSNGFGFGLDYGHGNGSNGMDYGGGGAYGGSGGNGINGGTGGLPYGSETYPNIAGSGGGISPRYYINDSGTGGGYIRIEAESVTLNGNISVNGDNGRTQYGSGGAGGGVLIIVDSFNGNGSINAMGGPMGSLSYAGGGGGGRVAIHALDYSYNGTIVVTGGVEGCYASLCGQGGSGGTVYINASTSVISSMNISVVGYNGTSGAGQTINITAPLLTLSGVYNATAINQSVVGVGNGTITLNYTDCASSYATATFDPAAIVQAPECVSPVTTISECRELNESNTVYQLDTNVNSTGTCFNITAQNVTLDCAGWNVNYSSNGTLGYGVYTNKNFTTIKNCFIYEKNSSGNSKHIVNAFRANGLLIINNTLENAQTSTGNGGYLINLVNSTQAIIRNNTFAVRSASSYGMYYLGSDNLVLEDNSYNLSGVQSGSSLPASIVYIDSSKNATIKRNNFSEFSTTNQKPSIYVFGLTADYYNHNIDESNKINDLPILYSFGNNSFSLENNADYSFIFIANSSSPVLRNVNITIDGLIFAHSTNVTVDNINITTRSAGINLLYVQEANVNNSRISSGSRFEGIRLYYSENVSVNNFSFFGSSTACDTQGFMLVNSNNNQFRTSNLSTNGCRSVGIYLSNSSKNYFEKIEVTTRSSSNNAYGLYMSSGSYDNVINLTIITATAGTANAVYISSGKNNNSIYNSNISSTNNNIYAYTDLSSGSFLSLYNTTWREGNSSINDDDFTIFNYNYLDVNVTDNLTSAAISDANVTTWNSTGALQFSVNSSASGFILTQTLLEFSQNSTAVSYAGLYAVNVTKSGYSNYSNATVNMSGNVRLDVRLGINSDPCNGPVSAQDWIIPSDKECILINRTFVMSLDKSISVYGNLSLVGVRIGMNLSADGTANFTVYGEGKLNITLGSEINSTNENNEYGLAAESGAQLFLSHSTFKDAGFSSATVCNRGICIKSENALIWNNSISGGYYSIFLGGNNTNFTGNSISNWNQGCVDVNDFNSSITENVFSGVFGNVYIIRLSAPVNNLIISQNSFIMLSETGTNIAGVINFDGLSKNILVENNKFVHTTSGISKATISGDSACEGCIFRKNSFTNYNGPAFYFSIADPFTGSFVAEDNWFNSSSGNLQYINVTSAYAANLTFLNTTNLNASMIYFDSASNGSVSLAWKVDVNVTNSTGTLNGANVSLYNGTNGLLFSEKTDISGFIPQKNVTSDYITSSGVFSRNPHLLNVSASGYSDFVNSNLNINQSVKIDIVLLLDSSPPNISIAYPINTTYSNYVWEFNYTVDATAQACWYSFDDGATNVSVTCGTNVTNYTAAVLGSNTWLVSANDSLGNVNVSRVTFSVDDVKPLINFTSPTPVNATNQTATSIFVNVSASDTIGNVSTFIDFDNSLVSWWRMDDLNSSGDVVDYMGRNNGTRVGNATQTNAGKMGKAMSFDGVEDNIDLSQNQQQFNMSLTNALTISAWVKPSENDSIKTIFSRGGRVGNGASNIVYVLGTYNILNNRNYWLATLSNGTDTLSAGSATTSAMMVNQWQHVLMTFNGTNVSLFFNGFIAQSAVSSNFFLWDGNQNEDRYVAIGEAAAQSSGNFNGSIDDVMIFNRSLSAEEIAALYANTSSRYLAVNYTNLAYGNHTFKAYTQDLAGNVNTTEKRQVEILQGGPTAMAVSASDNLSSGIYWNILSLPVYNLSAVGNNDPGETTYWINISVEGGTVDVYMRATGHLTSFGGDIIGIGNETFSFNHTNSSVPNQQKYSLSTNYADSKIGEAMGEGSVVYLKFFLNAPPAQAAGTYNNTVQFKVVPTGQVP